MRRDFLNHTRDFITDGGGKKGLGICMTNISTGLPYKKRFLGGEKFSKRVLMSDGDELASTRDARDARERDDGGTLSALGTSVERECFFSFSPVPITPFVPSFPIS